MESVEPFNAVILAGGRGSRLFPFTASLPKPLLPIGERTVIDLIIRRLADFEVRRVTVAVNYLADLVESFLGNGSRFGVPINYPPVGHGWTGRTIEPWTGPLVVMNGDVLADIDIRRLLACHRENKAAITVATMVQWVTVDSGVITTDSASRITDNVEKPSVKHRISLGVYVLSEEVASLIVRNERLEMPDLVMKIVGAGKNAIAYNHEGFWLDIGRPDDFARAQADATMWSERLGRTGNAVAKIEGIEN